MPVVALVVGAVLAGGAIAMAAMRARVKVPKPEDTNRGFDLSRSLDPNYRREVAVGLFATGGSGAYSFASGSDGEIQNKYAYRITVISDYEVTEFSQLLLDGSPATISGDPTTGWATVTDRYQLVDEDGNTTGPAIRVRVHLGAPGQVLDSEVKTASGGKFGTNDNFTGMCVLITRMEWNPETFQGGEPEVVFVGVGAPVHDPRDETSDATDPTTWSRTSDARLNAALVTAQVIRGFPDPSGDIVCGAGPGFVQGDISDAQLADAADICDELVATEDGTEPRYRVGGMVRSESSGIRPCVDKLIAAMDGDLIEDGGQLILLPGAERVPSAHYDLQAIGGRCLMFDPDGAATQRINELTCEYVEPEASFEMHALPPYRPAAYLEEDKGRRRSEPISLEMCPYRFQAGRIQKAKAEKARLQGRASFDLPLIAMQTQPGDWITVTDEVTGQVSAVWEVATARRTNSAKGGARVILECEEIAVEPWQWGETDTGAIGNPDIPVVPAPDYDRLTAPILTLTGVYIEGSGLRVPAIQAVAALPEAPNATHIDFEWRADGTTSPVFTLSVPKERGRAILQEGLTPGDVFEVRGRLRGEPGILGTWSSWGEVTVPADYFVPGLDGWPRERIDDLLNAVLETQRQSLQAFVEWGIEEAEQREGVERKAVNLYSLEVIERTSEDEAIRSTITTQISAVEDSIAGVQDEVTTVASDLAAETTTRTTQFSSLSGSISTLNTQYTTLATEQSSQASAITSLTASVNGLDSDLSALTLDVAAVSADVDDLIATRLIAVEAGAAYAGVQFSALTSGETEASDIRFAAGQIKFGPAFDEPRFIIDMENAAVYCLNAAGTVRTFELDLDTGDFWFRDASGNILLDKNGVTANGLGAVGSTQSASGSGTSGTLANSPSWTDVCSATIATAPDSGVMRVTGRIKGNSTNAALSGDWRVILRKTGETDVVVDSGDWEVRRFEYDNSPDPIIVAYAGSSVSISGSVDTPFGGSVTAILQANKPASTGTFTATGSINFERTP